MHVKYSYVEWIQNNVITIYCCDRKKINMLKSINARRKLFSCKYWIVRYKGDEELAGILNALRNECFLFGYDEHGWCPSGIFQLLREKGMVHGEFTEIFWRGPNKLGTRKM